MIWECKYSNKYIYRNKYYIEKNPLPLPGFEPGASWLWALYYNHLTTGSSTEKEYFGLTKSFPLFILKNFNDTTLDTKSTALDNFKASNFIIFLHIGQINKECNAEEYCAVLRNIVLCWVILCFTEEYFWSRKLSKIELK